jgi:hypothetical protein
MWDNPPCQPGRRHAVGIAVSCVAIVGVALLAAALRSSRATRIELTHVHGQDHAGEIESAARAHIRGNFFVVSPDEGARRGARGQLRLGGAEPVGAPRSGPDRASKSAARRTWACSRAGWNKG